jgi:hypothetical protein
MTTATVEFPAGVSFYRAKDLDVWLRWPAPEGGLNLQSLQTWLEENCAPGTDADVITDSMSGAIITVVLQPPTSYGLPDTRTAGRRFRLVRHHDVSGVSGTGVVAHGVQMPDGFVALRWCVPGMPATWNLFDAIEHVELLNGHQGKTEVEWID